MYVFIYVYIINLVRFINHFNVYSNDKTYTNFL